MRHQGSSWRARVTVLLAALLVEGVAVAVLPGAGASADPISEKRAQAAQLAGQIDRLGTRLEQLAEKYNAARLNADQVQGQVAKAAADVASANQQVEEHRAALRDIALQAYVGGTANPALDTVNGITDVAVQHVYMDNLASGQQDSLDGLRAAKLQLGEQQQRLAKAQADAKAAVAVVNKDQAAAASAQRAQEATLGKVKGELATLVAEEQARQAAEQAARARAEMLRQQVEAASRARAAAAAAAAAEADPSPLAPPRAPRATGPSASVDNTPDVPPVSGSGAAAAIAEAQRQVGKPYQWGAAGPGSFDCSGLTMWAWRAGGVSLPHYTGAQYSSTAHIPLSAIQPGDLLFYGSDLHHVGLYVGNGQMIEAPHSGTNVRYASIYRSDFYAASRPG